MTKTSNNHKKSTSKMQSGLYMEESTGKRRLEIIALAELRELYEEYLKVSKKNPPTP